jgi:hypothetical protein
VVALRHRFGRVSEGSYGRSLVGAEVTSRLAVG